MNAGLLSRWDILEYSVSGAAAYTRSALQGVQAGAELVSTYTPTQLLENTGISIGLYTEIANGDAAGLGTGYVRVQIPLLGIDETDSYTGGFQTSLSGRVEMDDVELWSVVVASVHKIRLKASALRIYAGGGLIYTHGSAVQLDAAVYAPSGIPLIGIPPTMSASSAVNPQITEGTKGGECTTKNDYATAQISATGGWRFKYAGEASWTALPVTLNILEPPALACDLAANRDDPSATTTYDAEVNAYAEVSDVVTYRGEVECSTCTNGTALVPAVFDVWDRVVESETRFASLTLMPDLSKTVYRLGDGTDYRALIERGGFPSTEATSVATCTDWVDDVMTSDSDTSEYHPEGSALLLPVDNAASVIEDPLGGASYAPYALNTKYFRARNFCSELVSPGTCPAALPEEPAGTIIDCITGDYDAVTNQLVSSFLPTVQESSGAGSNPDMLGYLDHLEPMPRYVNYWVNPHWSYSYYFPTNTIDTDADEIPDAQDIWELDGSEIDSMYYLVTRRQWITHPALDPADDHQTTNSLVSAPLRDGQHSLVWKAIWGTETSPWGICRFDAQAWDPVASVTLSSTSEDLWTGDDCTLAFGASITVTPSATECDVDLDLGSFTEPPYLFPHVAGSVTVGWAGGVSDVKVYVVNIAGEETLLTDNIEGTFAYSTMIAALNESFYAGSWKQDNGVGYIVDEGSDTNVAGISGATMAGQERVFAFQLVAGLTGATLRYRITVDEESEDPITLDYPVFIADTAPEVIQEQGHHAAVVYPDGPGVRFGNWSWYDYGSGTARTSPAVEPLGTVWAGIGHKASVLDWLRFNQIVLQSEPYDNDFATEVAALYDADEGSTAGDVSIDTLAFLDGDPLYAFLVNSWRELPPLAVFPVRGRSATWGKTGTPAQHVYSLAQSPRRYVSAQERIDLVDPSGPTTWTTLGTTVAGWTLTEHEEPITNQESYFEVHTSAGDIGLLRPWWGAFAVVPAGAGDDAATVGITHDRTLKGHDRHVFGWINGTGTSGPVVLVRSANTWPYVLDPQLLGITASDVHVRYDRMGGAQTLHLLTVQSGAVTLNTSTDDGQSWSADLTVGTGATKACIEISEYDGLRYVYWINTNAIKGRIYDASGNTLESEFTAVASAVGDYQIDARERVIEDGRRRITLCYIDTSNAVQVVESDDGMTFS